LPSPCVIRQLVNCPDLFDLAEQFPKHYPYLLENSGEATDLGRYDILFAFPGMQLVCGADGCLLLNGKEQAQEPFLDQLDSIYKQSKYDASSLNDESLANELPFTGGWFLYLGYELAAEIEPVLQSSS